MYVKYEISFDGFYKDSNKVFRVIASYSPPNGEAWSGSVTPPPMAKSIRNSFPEVESVGRLLTAGASVYHYKEKYFEEDNAFFTEPEILGILDIQLITGDNKDILKAPQTMIVSETIAKKIFGNENPVGKVMTRNRQDFEITGIFKDYPRNSHIQPNVLMSYSTPNWILNEHDDSWNMFWVSTYVKLYESSSKVSLKAKLTKLIESNKTPDMAQNKHTIELQAVPDIHLRSTLKADQMAGGNMLVIRLLGGIALLILIIGLINHANTATAQIFDRLPQIGIKKILGSSFGRLIAEFIWETFIIYFAALFLSLIAVYMVLPMINNFLDANLGFYFLGLREYLTGLAIVILCILLSSLYPTLLMLSIQPVKILKAKVLNTSSGLRMRKSLIGFQYFISFSLIFFTLIIYKQTQLLIKNDLGISTSGILVIKADESDWNSFPSQMNAFKGEILKLPEVIGVTRSNALPGLGSYNDGIKSDNEGKTYKSNFNCFDADEDFIKTMGLKILAGRDFYPGTKNNNNDYILTLEGTRILGFDSPQDAIGKEITRDYGNVKVRIVGVVNDFKLTNKSPTSFPSAINVFDHSSRFIAIKFSNANYANIQKRVKQIWQNNFGDQIFRNFFLTDAYKEVYNKEVFQSKLFSSFALLSILISALGLFGLAHFTIVKREKEFSIRKVNGAKVKDIFDLVFFSFFKLILAATLISIPIMWWLSSYWLNNYRERINIEWWFFFIPFILLSLVTLLTISYHTLKTAWINPVELLKNK